ncbi:MAG TPA: hypothetical protein DCL42_03355 [Deltaproteobacteria bacterium]|nr:hypothetical protein [Deltaproteobacteria bacterium]
MQRPKRKQINKLTPTLLQQPIVAYLLLFQDAFYDSFCPCPRCGSSNSKKHHVEEHKLFCKVIIKGRFKDITVTVQVFY